MSTVALVMSLSKTPVEYEAFPKGTKRSLEGALRLLPNFPVEITADELDVLKSAGVPLQVLIEPKAPVKKSQPKPKAPVKKKSETPVKKFSAKKSKKA